MFRANYANGTSAATRTALVILDAGGINFRLDETGEIRQWATDTLSTAQPVSKSDQDVLLHSTAEPNASLFVQAPEFVTALLAQAPALGTGRHRILNARVGLSIMGVVLAMVGIVWAFDLSPARGVAMAIPDRTWQNSGRRLIGTFTAERARCTEARGITALNKMLARLSTAGGKQQFEVTVSDWDLVNAFMLPGRQMVLTKGIINNVSSPEELAGVIAHEMGHGIEQHPETGIVRALGISFATQLLFTGTGDTTITNIGALLLTIQYTRGAEKEADNHAIAILRAARISPKPFAAFFQRMMSKEKSKAPAPNPRDITLDIFSTHPNSEDRAQKALSQPDYPTEPALSPADWQDLRAICGTMSKTPPRTSGKTP